MNNNEEIYVIGHKNPDTDSICSAISYAYLKNAMSRSKRYVPRRAGQINEETEFVLKYFNMDTPDYMPNVGCQVSDMTIEDTEGAPADVTVRIAWEYMKESGTVTLPVMKEDNTIQGLLTVDDIADYFMDSYNKTILAEARTKFYDIAETVNGTVVAGNAHGCLITGKILVGAAMPDKVTEYMGPDDLVILGDREDTQRAAIEGGASCIVVCLADDVTEGVKALAEEKQCVIICTRFDTYIVSRLISQAIPASFLIRDQQLLSFRLDDYVDDIRDKMGKSPLHDFPVTDFHGTYVGMISRRSLINVRRKKLILVDHTEKSQAVDNLEQAQILEIVDHHRIGTVETMQPVFFRGEPVGCTCTILFSMFREMNIPIPREIAGLMMSAIISDTLLYRSPTCTPRDIEAGNALAAIVGVDIEKYAKEMFRAGSSLEGKSADEILHQDFKKFIFGETVMGVGQISSMDSSELVTIAEKLLPQMEMEAQKSNMQMVFFMLTDILTEDTLLLTYGKGSDELVLDAFGAAVENRRATLKGVVSRKKQLIPSFMTALQS